MILFETTTPDTLKTYFVNGLLKSIDNGTSNSDFAYNNRNELTSETQTLAARPARVVSYSYDADGLRTGLVYPSARLVDLAWTARAQLLSVSADGPPPLGIYNYDKAFFRLQYTDQAAADLENADFDGDGLTNLQEITPVTRPGAIAARGIGGAPAPNTNQTNPLDGDTDHDGLGDKFERDNGLDPTDDGSIDPNNGPNGDPDGDGVTNSAAQAAANLPKPNLSTDLVYRGALYTEQRFDFGAYAQTTLYSTSLVDFYRSIMLSNYIIKSPNIRGTVTINSDSAYIEPSHPTDPQQAFAALGIFKAFFKTKFPVPLLSPIDDLSTWSLANSVLKFGGPTEI